jgi:hypothetical protein
MISASFGASFRVEMKKREARMMALLKMGRRKRPAFYPNAEERIAAS